jgi:hypothetical protein
MSYGLSNYTAVKTAIETTPGTFPNTTELDILFTDAGFAGKSYGMTDMGNRSDGKMLKTQSVKGVYTKSGTLTFPFAFSGTSADPGNLEKILLTSGMKSVAGTPHSYTFDGKINCEGLGIAYIYQGCDKAVTEKIKGALGNLTISADAVGAQIMGSYEFTGVDAGTATDTSFSETLASGTPEIGEAFLDTPITIDGTQYVAKSFSLTFGASIGVRTDSAETEGGISAIYSGAFSPQLTVVLEDFDPAGLEAKLKTNTVITANTKIETDGFDINITEANLFDLQDQDTDGVVTKNTVLEVREFNITRK